MRFNVSAAYEFKYDSHSAAFFLILALWLLVGLYHEVVLLLFFWRHLTLLEAYLCDLVENRDDIFASFRGALERAIHVHVDDVSHLGNGLVIDDVVRRNFIELVPDNEYGVLLIAVQLEVVKPFFDSLECCRLGQVVHEDRCVGPSVVRCSHLSTPLLLTGGVPEIQFHGLLADDYVLGGEVRSDGGFVE